MRINLRLAALAAVLLIGPAITGTVVQAQPQSDAGPVKLARDIELRADKTSFADLERFGDMASVHPGVESLSRLQHVAWILLNQSEFDRFEHWNGLLKAQAQRLGNHRYLAMANINELKARYDSGDVSTHPIIAQIARTEPDWFARIHAASVDATLLIEEDQTGAALKELSQAEVLIPEGDPAADAAESDIWETIGLALMQLDDLEGSAQAFERADFEFADNGYPRPDFDGVYNMAHMAVQLGDGDLARTLAAVHHRLAARSDLPHLDVWDKNLCAMVADAFGAPAEVMGCMRGLDGPLTGAEFLAPDLLPLRAIAEARLGDIPAAQADLGASGPCSPRIAWRRPGSSASRRSPPRSCWPRARTPRRSPPSAPTPSSIRSRPPSGSTSACAS